MKSRIEALTTGFASPSGLDIVETNAEIKTSYGTCDAVFIPTKSGAHPKLLLWLELCYVAGVHRICQEFDLR